MKKYNSVTPGTIIAGVAYMILTLIILLSFIFLVGMDILAVLILLLWLYWCSIMIFNGFLRKIHIDDEGIKSITPFKTIFISWSDIEEINVSRAYMGLRGGATFIYFSTKYGASPRDKDATIISMRYRKSVLDEIKKYWSGRISERRM
ncbi:hypothetical protein [Clostridium formicaceticum]|uniref:Uncharacterized protein n=1 Tax=Clostridium formicaceticum TaxID=1497 RepID=A0AAC9WF57_9CLOT|nr:hypothetical protein [Clostridium formicaceticum]AOY76012.1 hypothetical protein BJL90_08940 [Clostridium formicaceticum]ARE86368.1 hypothetical protein CLFO_06900 [Clostridium formicaceticum]